MLSSGSALFNLNDIMRAAGDLQSQKPVSIGPKASGNILDRFAVVEEDLDPLSGIKSSQCPFCLYVIGGAADSPQIYPVHVSPPFS